tara:strand:+ start:169650 stop:170063 length:414 start_codon:yes stop_codon:yes gene_type:complete
LDEQQLLERFQSNAPDFLKRLGGRFTHANPATGTCVMAFDISRDFCHSIDVVQGGFITTILDIAMTHAAFASSDSVSNIASLEIKTMYLEPTRAGQLRVEGSVTKLGYKTAFLEGRVYNSDGLLTATASSVAKVMRN